MQLFEDALLKAIGALELCLDVHRKTSNTTATTLPTHDERLGSPVTPPVSTPTYFDTKAASDYLSLSASTLHKYRTAGGGPKFIKLGRNVRYVKTDLDTWAEAHRFEHTSAYQGTRKAKSKAG